MKARHNKLETGGGSMGGARSASPQGTQRQPLSYLCFSFAAVVVFVALVLVVAFVSLGFLLFLLLLLFVLLVLFLM